MPPTAEDSYSQEEKLEGNKQATILGRAIYVQDLNSLVPKNSKSFLDFYVTNSVLDVYLPIISFESRYNANNVTVFYTEGIFLNYTDSEKSHENSFHYIMKHNLPDFDVVIIPIIYNNHYTMIILLRKQKILIYLFFKETCRISLKNV